MALSAGGVLELIRGSDGLTRQELMDLTGMSRPSIIERLDALFAAGLIYESGAADSTGGRRAQRISFDDRGPFVLTIDLGQTHCRLSTNDVRGAELRAAEYEVHVADDPASVIERILGWGDELIAAETNRPEARLIGVGFGLPGTVSEQTGRSLKSTVIPGWDSYPLADTVRRHWRATVLFENDARALAVGEWTGSPGADVLVGVKIATGIGAGIVDRGQLIRGTTGFAGDIGHLRIGPRTGPLCTCGRRGCLAALASGRALVAQLGDPAVTTAAQFVALVEERGPKSVRALTLLDEAADRIGQTLAVVIGTINPDVLALGGVIGRLPRVQSHIRRVVGLDVLERTRSALRVQSSTLGRRAIGAGLVKLVSDSVYSRESVDALVR